MRSATLLERPLCTELDPIGKSCDAQPGSAIPASELFGEREELLARTYTLFRELQHRVKNNLQVI